jgi:hypothetical protein
MERSKISESEYLQKIKERKKMIKSEMMVGTQMRQ